MPKQIHVVEMGSPPHSKGQIVKTVLCRVNNLNDIVHKVSMSNIKLVLVGIVWVACWKYSQLRAVKSSVLV